MHTQAPIKDQLQSEYAQIVAGFKRNDPEPWIVRLSPDFKLKLFSGSEQSRDWAVNYVRQNATTFSIDSLTIKIESITPEAGSYVARVRQTSSRTYLDERGTRQRLDVDVVQLERWRKVSSEWKLEHVTESEVLSLKRSDVK
jgi:hypothetical protein